MIWKNRTKEEYQRGREKNVFITERYKYFTRRHRERRGCDVIKNPQKNERHRTTLVGSVLERRRLYRDVGEDHMWKAGEKKQGCQQAVSGKWGENFASKEGGGRGGAKKKEGSRKL